MLVEQELLNMILPQNEDSTKLAFNHCNLFGWVMRGDLSEILGSA